MMKWREVTLATKLKWIGAVISDFRKTFIRNPEVNHPPIQKNVQNRLLGSLFRTTDIAKSLFRLL